MGAGRFDTAKPLPLRTGAAVSGENRLSRFLFATVAFP